jgi:O-antigen/teichoic acid export membrane protein
LRREQRGGAAHAALTPLQGFARLIRLPGFGRTVARTAGFNVASMVAGGLGGTIVARALGATVCGEYAAVTSWFGIVLMVGGMGQPAALCFFVASDPQRAR